MIRANTQSIKHFFSHYKKSIFIFFITFLISILPFLIYKGIPFGHDTSFHMSRIQAVYQGLLEGRINCGVYPEYFGGLGYGAGLFYPGFFLFFPALLMILGASAVFAYKLFLILIALLMGLSMYYAVIKVWHSHDAALISSSAYMLCSYHITDMYIRSTLGELMAFVFIPLVIAGLIGIIKENNNWQLLTLGMSGLILSHILTSFITIIICVIIGLAEIKEIILCPKKLLLMLKAMIITLILTAFFIFPMLEQYIVNPIWGDTGLLGNIADWAVVPWQTILAIPTKIGELYVPPAGIGIGLAIVGILGLILKSDHDIRKLLLVLGWVLLFCSTTLFPWQFLGNYLQTLQFPWRFYFFTSVLFCFCSGDTLLSFKTIHLRKRAVIFFLCIMFISFSYNIIDICKTKTFVESNPYPNFAAGCEYLPQKMDYGQLIQMQNNPQPSLIRNGNTYQVMIYQKSQVIPLVYYKGYVTTYNGDKIKNYCSDNGFLIVETQGSTTTGALIEISYDGTIIKHISNGITMLGLSGICVISLIKNKRSRKCKKN